MLAIVCPGQGAQKPGFLSPWLELPGVREQLASLSSSAELDLIAHGTVSDADTIRDTAVAQPLLVAAGIVAAGQLGPADDGPELAPADLLAGHSVGELTAAALGDVLSDEDAMRLVAVRSRAMAEAAAAEQTSMAAVVGGVREEVLEAIDRHGLHPANINSAAQVVAAGSPEALTALAQDAPSRARVIPLQVAGAFHTPYMAAARQTLADFVPTLQPADPTMPLISNAGGELVTSGSHYLQSIVTQVASPVDWEAGMAVMREKGVTAMIEVAPAGTLTGLAKRDLKGIATLNLNTPDDLEPARELIREHAGRAVFTDSEEN
ncbi:MAG TPA: ACP S-malonyltransferase [Candidatus Brachybacterium merdavium]|uniref:[acyl-carrier-protein] S-malonyltransferase n=1 Tax=Candidatus Brachybacterium merdavium TaxID=2838513 RepID=A0A9D2LC06_9MICO|nr:ACP S-malonyltransferase [Candidatus Brachybacterium merdavium]